MENHKCKLCPRNFPSRKALGGHMRSHMMNLNIQKRAEESQKEAKFMASYTQNEGYAHDSRSAPSLSVSSSSGRNVVFHRGSRENLKRSSRLGDLEHAFGATNTQAELIVHQNGESETESSKNSPIRRRSDRIRRSRPLGMNPITVEDSSQVKRSKFEDQGKTAQNEHLEQEPFSSISETTPEEDVAYCLMMLSRDKWIKEQQVEEELESGEELKLEYVDEDEEDSECANTVQNRGRGKYRCETCNRGFKSYQALGGHKASHKRIKIKECIQEESSNCNANNNAGDDSCILVEEKIHECPVCYKVFPSGQALGGHKRSHGAAGKRSGNVCADSVQKNKSLRIGEPLDIDLNLPAPFDDEDDEEISRSSVVSDEEIV